MKLHYRPELDGVRALAVTMVALFHTMFPTFPGGARGVDVFFVLSGYLITSILLGEYERRGEIDLRGFLLRRARRLYPALLLLIAVYLALVPFIWPRDAPYRLLDMVFAAAYMMDIVKALATWASPLLHTWSLAVEAQFYAVWPLAIPWLARLPRKRAAALLALTALAITLARAGYLLTTHDDKGAYFLPVFRASGLLLGSTLAFWSPRLRMAWLGLAALPALTVWTSGESTFGTCVAIPIAEVATALIILDPPRFLAARPLVAFGKVSYGFYLWHYPIWLVMGRTFGLALALKALPLAAVAASVSYHTVERLRMIRRDAQAAPTQIA